jgi:hypothetical protein
MASGFHAAGERFTFAANASHGGLSFAIDDVVVKAVSADAIIDRVAAVRQRSRG